MSQTQYKYALAKKKKKRRGRIDKRQACKLVAISLSGNFNCIEKNISRLNEKYCMCWCAVNIF